MLMNYYQGIITDKTRVKVIERAIFESFHMILLLIIIPLSVIGLCCPFFVIWLDKADYEDLEMDTYEDIPDEVCDQIARTRDYKCI